MKTFNSDGPIDPPIEEPPIVRKTSDPAFDSLDFDYDEEEDERGEVDTSETGSDNKDDADPNQEEREALSCTDKEKDDETAEYEPSDGTDEELQEAEEFGKAWSEEERKYEGD